MNTIKPDTFHRVLSADSSRKASLSDDGEDSNEYENRLVYRMQESGPPLLREVLEDRGWIPYVEGETPYWNLFWKGSRYRKSDYEQCLPFQRLNHFPNTLVITRKDSLFRLLRTMKGIYGSVYNFFPVTFAVPNEFIRLVRYINEEVDAKKPKSTWICKPADLSRGRGIFVFRDIHELTYDCSAVVQKYIPNPLLVSGYKFDLRCYILVRSYNPLQIYLYNEGLARFATSRYDMSSLDNKFSHLTNTSINKFSPTLESNKNDVGPGCKWTFAKLKDYMNSRQVDFELIWNQIKGIILLTMLPVAEQVAAHSESCFELYGFDILIDENFKAWLLEVNLSPALSVDEATDVFVKKALLSDIIDLVGLTERDGEAGRRHSIESAKPPPRRRSRASISSLSSKSSSDTSLSSSPSIATGSRRSKDAPMIKQYPEKVGQFVRIFPNPDFKVFPASSRKIPKVGDPGTKNLVQEIKRAYFSR